MRLQFALACVPIFVSASAQADIHYRVTANPTVRTFAVQIKFEAGDTTAVHIPAWCPGYYVRQNYSRKISDFKAVDDAGTPYPLQVVDDWGWKIRAPKGSSVTVSYKVLGDDGGLGFFGARLDTEQGFINGASTFMYVDGRETEPDTLEVKPPENWEVASSLDKDKDGLLEATTGYDELIDSPLQMGHFVTKNFTVRGVPFKAIFVPPFSGRIACNPDAEVERLRRVSGPAIDLFGGAPFKHYTYLLHLSVGSFDGGLEHRACTCIAIPNTPHLDLDDLAAHENFHAWNVKQIRPVVLGPFDYSKPDRTGNLWFAEGVTDYYAKILTYRSGLKDVGWLLAQFKDQIQELQSGKTRKSVTLEDASRNCWENDGFSVGDMSYYTKGLLCGLILDATIRSQTDGKKSLDDVMRYLYAKTRLPQPGYSENGLLEAVNAVVGKPTLSALYTTMVRSTAEMPYDLLRCIAIDATVPGAGYPVAGFSLRGSVVTEVGERAIAAGLRVGDQIENLSDYPVDGSTAVTEFTGRYTLDVIRDGEHEKIYVPYSVEYGRGFDFFFDSSAGPRAIALRNNWLKRPDPSKKDDDHGPVSGVQSAGK